jgi:hypothetical protein
MIRGDNTRKAQKRHLGTQLRKPKEQLNISLLWGRRIRHRLSNRIVVLRAQPALCPDRYCKCIIVSWHAKSSVPPQNLADTHLKPQLTLFL